ncbi:thioredoxin-disulfide reductase [Buchnera aphidicola (Mollitrichosiphum nigrofasciatum)]|uniref:thioredoxin-disulfide reductase n=1 Tax=Buchnera aphidicola TaxID=9 RepID=UPI0031B8159D
MKNFKIDKKIKYSQLIILGSGPAGYTAGIYAGRANLKPFLITGNDCGGQLIKTEHIENWPGEINNISGLKLMNRMQEQVKKNNVKIFNDHINTVNLNVKPFSMFGYNTEYQSDALIIATGASARYLGLPSEEYYKGKGVSACAICDGPFFKNKKVAIVGGGNTALEDALFLSKIVKKIYIIHRNKKFRAEKILISRVMKQINEKKIDLYLNCTIKEILGNENNITGIKIISKKDIKFKKKINIEGLFIAIGHDPNTHIFNKKIKMNNGYIIVKSGNHGNFTQTNIPGIFAAGDVIDHVYKQAITSASSGCMAAIDASRYLEQLQK